MAEISADLKSWLTTKSAITSLVGSSTGARIFPERPKQNAALPYLIITQSYGRQQNNLGGRVALQECQFEILSVGETRNQADELSTAVHNEMTPSNKTMGSSFVTEIMTELHRDSGDDLPQDGSDRARYWSRSVYRLFVIL